MTLSLLCTGYNECAKPWSNLIPFLCGSSKDCRKRNEDALQGAKKNVRDKYLVVGLAEDLPNTVKAFEMLIPSVFNGARKIYQNQSTPVQLQVGKGIFYNCLINNAFIEPNEIEVHYLKRRLVREYELYNYVKQQFYEKVNEL